MLQGMARLFCSALMGWSVLAAPIADTRSFALGSRELFGAYEDNFVLVQRMSNNGWAEDDETALRAHCSLRYVFYGRKQYEISASYTGEFDFYMGTRPSGPVINRLSNPAVHIRWPASSLFRNAGQDGQVVEVTSIPEAEAAQHAYDTHDRPYFDQISRGSNYVSLAARFAQGTLGLPFSLRVKARIYVTQNSEVTWGPQARQNVCIADYDRMTLRLGRQTRLGEFEGEWTVGDKGLKTDSLELGWQAPGKWYFPIYLRLHRGPRNTLSNYTQRQDSVAVGLRFASF
jgi:hypothetical protein